MKTARERNPGVELFRCVMMMTICIYHVSINGGYLPAWLMNLMLIGVVGFGLISGWFGVSFSVRRIARLYGYAFYGVAVAVVLQYFWGQETMSFKDCLLLGLDIFRSYWFLHAYAILLAFSPLINRAIEYALRESGRRGVLVMLLPILFVVFGWSFLGEVRYVKWIVPISFGLTQHSGLTLIGIYCAARVARLYENAFPADAKWILMAVVALSTMVAVGHFGFYESPFMFLVALCAFALFKNFKIGGRMSKAICIVSPSMFSVYLIHTNISVEKIVRQVCEVVGGGNMSILKTIGVGIVVLTVACVLNMPRRLFVSTVKHSSH